MKVRTLLGVVSAAAMREAGFGKGLAGTMHSALRELYIEMAQRTPAVRVGRAVEGRATLYAWDRMVRAEVVAEYDAAVLVTMGLGGGGKWEMALSLDAAGNVRVHGRV